MLSKLYLAVAGALSNQLITGGFILMWTGALMAMLRNLPNRVIFFCRERMAYRLVVTQRDVAFQWMETWLNDRPYTKRARSLMVTTRYLDSDNATPDSVKPVQCGDGGTSEQPDHQVLFTPAKGSHYFRHNGTLIHLQRDGGEAQPAGKETHSNPGLSPETITVEVFTRSQAKARSIIEEARQSAMRNIGRKVLVFTCSYGGWRNIGIIESRSLDSVILPEGELDAILDDVRGFLASKQWYQHRGIPWRRGYLFKGVAGAGKTSLISAIAGECKLNLYVLSLTGPGMNDERLVDLVTSVMPRSAIVLEDIDAVAPSRDASTVKQGEQPRVTLSGLLNVLDGILSRDGAIVFMTTNHPERIDPALIRPGRADMHWPFWYASRDQIERVSRRFFPEMSEDDVRYFADRFNERQVSMAEVQGELLRLRDSRPAPARVATATA